MRAICCFDVCFLSFPFLSSSFPFSSILQPGSEEPEPASFAQRAYHPDAVTRSQGALQIEYASGRGLVGAANRGFRNEGLFLQHGLPYGGYLFAKSAGPVEIDLPRAPSRCST